MMMAGQWGQSRSRATQQASILKDERSSGLAILLLAGMVQPATDRAGKPPGTPQECCGREMHVQSGEPGVKACTAGVDRNRLTTTLATSRPPVRLRPREAVDDLYRWLK
jgi:hypothetical protein